MAFNEYLMVEQHTVRKLVPLKFHKLLEKNVYILVLWFPL